MSWRSVGVHGRSVRIAAQMRAALVPRRKEMREWEGREARR